MRGRAGAFAPAHADRNGAIEVRDPQAAYIDVAQLRAALGQAGVDPDVVWAKLAAMAEGARIALRKYWKS